MANLVPFKKRRKGSIMKFPYLHEDMIINILSKLPVKSIIRFKCVCKSWYSIITSPYFVSMHLNGKNRHQDYLAFVFCQRITGSLSIHFSSYHTTKFSSNLDMLFDNANFIGFCNGLLCVVANQSTFYIINPATKEFKVKELNKPLGSPSYGFAFDSKANDYKLVRVTLQKTEVLTLKSNYWKPILMTKESSDIMEKVHDLVDFRSNATIKNTLHWIGRLQNGDKKFIMAFDLADEGFREIKIPGDDDEKSSNFFGHHCSVYQDCLSISFHHGLGFEHKIEVWIMKEYGVEKTWTKKYCFSMSSDVCRKSFDLNVMRNLQYMWVGKKGGQRLQKLNRGKLIFDEITVHPDYGRSYFSYSESLVPIDTKDDEDQ